MSILSQSRYFYKLCLVYNGKLYCCSDRRIELTLFTAFSQDISESDNCVFIYSSPELAVTKEKHLKSTWKRTQKQTIVKLMGTGDYIGDNDRRAYATMTVLSDIGLPQVLKLPSKRTESTNRVVNKRTQSTHKSKIPNAMLTPIRIYTSSNMRKKSPNTRNNSRPVSNIRTGRDFFDTVYKKYQRIKQETKWLVGQVEYLENINKFNRLEDLDSLSSSNE